MVSCGSSGAGFQCFRKLCTKPKMKTEMSLVPEITETMFSSHGRDRLRLTYSKFRDDLQTRDFVESGLNIPTKL
jgi:hypothetical protein